MTFIIDVKEPKPSDAAIEMVAEINRQFDSAKDLVVKTYNQLVLSDGFTPKQAKKFLYENITIFSDRTIRKYLPEEAKDLSKVRTNTTNTIQSHFAEVLPQTETETAIDIGTDLKRILGKNAFILPPSQKGTHSTGGRRGVWIKDILVGIEKLNSTDVDCFNCLAYEGIEKTYKNMGELTVHLITEHHASEEINEPQKSELELHWLTIGCEYIDLSELKINEEYQNLRVDYPLKEGRFENFKRFLRKYGNISALVINKDNVILDGHIRYRACSELGVNRIGVRVKEFDNEFYEKGFIIETHLGIRDPGRRLHEFQVIVQTLKLKAILDEMVEKNNISREEFEEWERLNTDQGMAYELGLEVINIHRAKIILEEANVSKDDERIIKILKRLNEGTISLRAAYKRIKQFKDYREWLEKHA